MDRREPPTIDEKRVYRDLSLDHARSGISATDQPTPSYVRPAPPTPKISLGADATGSGAFTCTPKSPVQSLRMQGHHRRSISQAPDPLPKTDPWRKETGWNWPGCMVYTLFLAAYIFYYYVRIRYTLQGGILWYSIAILVFELLASSSMVIHGLCLLRVRLPRKSTEPVPAQPFVVRVLIPCYTESLEIVAQTVQAAANADLPPKACRTVYLLDDGKDPAKSAWVAEQGREDIVYISGRVRSKGETNGKACNLNNTLHQLYPKDVPVDDMELVVIFDADMVCYKEFFVKILAELYDPQVAIVLTPQKFHNYDIQCDIFNHSNLIYWQVSLPGLDGWDNVSCTGTNFVIRARAAQEAGWFPTYTLGEDMALALEVQKEGWKGAYVKEYLAIGEVPETIRNAFMQKSRWCKGGMQIFFSKHNAIFAKNLSIMQRIVWNTSGWSYICTTLTTPVFLVIPVIGVWAGYFPLQFNWWFALAFTIYSPCCYLLLYYCTSPSHLRSIYFSIVAAHMFWFAYAKATFNTIFSAVFKREIKFKTTEKSVMAATVTDLANKAKQKVKSKTSPFGKMWSRVQDIYVHFVVLLVCGVSIAVAIVTLVETFDPHTWQSISVLVSIGWLTYNMMAPAMLMWQCAFGNRGLTTLCTLISLLTAVVLAAIVVIIWLVLPNEYSWTDLLGKSLTFYDAQKSGRLPASNPIPWRGDSALTDAAPNGASLVGGYYDDGGFVKNGFALASTIALLAWGMLEYPGGYAKAGQMQHGLDTLRWGTDYMLASYLGEGTNGTTYVAQVGSYVYDAQSWERPEQMNMSRPSYVVNNSAPGSDLMGATAAALAASSLVFAPTDSSYATKLQTTAETLYNAGAGNLGLYTDSVPDARFGFPSSGYLDDLAWGSAWLYRLTQNATYLDASQSWFTAAQYNTSQSPQTPMAWNYDNQLPGTAVLLANFSNWQNASVVSEVDAYLDAWRNAKGGVLRTGSYLSYVGPDGSLRNAANVALLARIHDKYNTAAKHKYDCWSEYEARVLLGDGRQSYLVGGSHNPPVQAQHRAASCAGPYTTPCPTGAEASSAPNPWVLTGALVSGPTLAIDTAFVDVRDQPDVRVSIEYNAGFTGLMAALAESAPSSYTHCSQGHGFIYSRSTKSPV